MRVFGDYHTHTIYSRHHHGKNTILENAVCAKARGLKEIAITDHGYNHFVYGVKRKKLDKIKNEIEFAKKVTGIDIYLGVEANFISLDGTIDVTNEDYEKLDILLVGYHQLVKPKSLKDMFLLFISNRIFRHFKASEKRLKRNTEMVLKALEEYNIDVITHLGYKMPVDIEPIAKKAKERGTYIELNGKKCNFTDKEMEILIKSGVKFIVNSDAHSALRVGELRKPINYVLKYNIDDERVVNIDKLPIFKKVRN